VTGSIARFLDERLAEVLSHPLRARILQRLNERGVASPKELARALGESVGNVSYHALWPAATTALARSTPMPRPAPVMNQVFLSAVMGQEKHRPSRVRVPALTATCSIADGLTATPPTAAPTPSR
jgi:Helix-turn-helix domain